MPKKIVYNGVTFDDFVRYNDDGGELADDTPKANVIDYGVYICPWCQIKYGFFIEAYNTEESVLKEIESYKDSDDPFYRGPICGVEGCENGVSDDAYLPADSVTEIN